MQNLYKLAKSLTIKRPIPIYSIKNYLDLKAWKSTLTTYTRPSNSPRQNKCIGHAAVSPTISGSPGQT